MRGFDSQARSLESSSAEVHRGDALKPQDDYSSLVYTLRFIESGVRLRRSFGRAPSRGLRW